MVQTSHYAAPQSLDEASALLAEYGSDASVLAGGTDLLVQTHISAEYPRYFVDVKAIPQLRALEVGPAGLRLGAAVPAAELGEHAALRHAYPGLVEAAELIGSTQIQSRATVGGNLCNGSPAADTVPALMALDAECTVLGPQGRRTLAVADVVIGPGKTALAANELLVEFRAAAPARRSADAYQRFIPRSEMDIAVVGVGVAVTIDASGICTHARVTLGAVGPTPLLAEAASAALVGTDLGDAAWQEAGRLASAAAKPIDDRRGTAEFRRRIVTVLVRRVGALARDRASDPSRG
jgi:CO/xanthine dehydrogenase FAD-binding subunit